MSLFQKKKKRKDNDIKLNGCVLQFDQMHD